jgi:deoxyribonuclease IV
MKIGAHMSIAGGLHLAFERSAEIGATSLQIFSKSPRGWSMPAYTDEQFALAREYRVKYKQEWGIIHANYLANLSKPADECKPDIASIIHDFYVGTEIGFEWINVHIGKQKWFENKDDAFANMKKNVEYILDQCKQKWYTPKFLFEITAGQGSELGTTIEEIWYFYQHYLKDLPIAFCFDTAHARWAWNDLWDRDTVIKKRDKEIGIDKLFAFHLNDSKAALWSHLDRHAPLGRGAIWWMNLIPIIQRAAKHNKPIYLETTDNERRPEEIQYVRDIIAGKTWAVEKLHTSEYKTELLKKFQAGGDQSLFG